MRACVIREGNDTSYGSPLPTFSQMKRARRVRLGPGHGPSQGPNSHVPRHGSEAEAPSLLPGDPGQWLYGATLVQTFPSGLPGPRRASKACLGLAEAPWEPPRGRIPHTPCWALHQPLNLGPEFSTGQVPRRWLKQCGQAVSVTENSARPQWGPVVKERG